MAESLRADLVAQFTGVTGCEPERAQFYLESAAWNLDMAIASFYDGDGDEDEPEIVSTEPGAGSTEPVPDPSPPPQKTHKQKKPKQQSRFGTIGGMRDEESDSDDEKGQAFYAGGSETSGQQILGPPKKKAVNELVQDMFDQAKEHGAETVEAGTTSQATGPSSTFRGTGYRLGESEADPIVAVAGAPIQDHPEQVDMVLKLWKTGFSVDDGPVRDYKDPANQEFLSAIKRGEVPRELVRMAKGGEVNLNMEDHREEEYVKPKVAIKAFSGEGHRLGSPAGNVMVTNTSPSKVKKNEEAAKSAITVDASQPTTQLQLRLSDGSRLVAKFNHNHTVADVRQYIYAARPETSGTNFVLMTTFPNKEVTDETVTLKSAGLLNAVLVQRLK